MDGGSATSGHDSPSGLSLVMGRGSSASLSPLDHTAPTCSLGPHPRLGPQGCGRSSSASALLSLPFVRSPSLRQQTPPSHHRLVPAQPVRLRSPVHSQQSHGTGAPPNASVVTRHARHLRGVYPYTDAAQSLPLPRHLVPGPTLLFSRPSLRPQCRPVYFYAGPCMASPLPAGQGDFPSRLLRRHCRLAPGSRHVTGPSTAGYGLSAGYGFPTQPRRQLERLVGVVNFACQVHRFLRPFLQPLTKGGTIARAAERDTPAPLPPPMRETLTFWTSPTPWLHVPRFHSNLPCRSLWTDASHHGWGALLQPSLTGSGEWSPEERVLHVNLLELRAVLRALQFFDLRHLSLRIFTDNESVRYTLAACRTKSLALWKELIALLSALQARYLTFQVLRVPTPLNVVADALSRSEPLNTEWTLPQLSFGAILRWAGPLEVDLMASPINHRLPRWVSAFPHPDAMAVDCRSIDWAAFRSLYLFPPLAMLPQLLHRILECPARLVVVVPWKPHEPWFPPLLQGAVSHLHLRTTLFQQTGSGTVWHSSGTSARWTALLFCGKS